jgi:hypothetical protein
VSNDLAGRVAEIFRNSLPTIDYGILPDTSIRNRLLAHYLIGSMLPSIVNKVMVKDTGKDCIPKLAILDEGLYLTSHVSLRRYPNGRLSSILPSSSLDKTLLMVGIRIYRELLEYDGTPQAQEPNPLDYKDSPAFKGITDGANPEHAAACYMQMMSEAFEPRLGNCSSTSDLRELLAAKQYHERISLPEIRAENMATINDYSLRMPVVFLATVVNWNKDNLMRLAISNK